MKYFTKYFRAKNVMKFYITTSDTAVTNVMLHTRMYRRQQIRI